MDNTTHASQDSNLHLSKDDSPLLKRSNDSMSKFDLADDATDSPGHTPTGMGSEAAEWINDMGKHVQGERSGLDDRRRGRLFREGAERSGSEPLLGHTWLHESGYSGRDGEPRTSSDQREDSERGSSKQEGCVQERAEQENSEHDLSGQA